nr:hypothetical protein [Pedobacter panaciterrae]
MRITLDIKSMIFGFMAAGLILIAFSFKNGQNDQPGKYRTTIGEKGGIVILDTETGAYIIAPEIRDFGKVQWIKGDFNATYQTGKDNKKVN